MSLASTSLASANGMAQSPIKSLVMSVASCQWYGTVTDKVAHDVCQTNIMLLRNRSEVNAKCLWPLRAWLRRWHGTVTDKVAWLPPMVRWSPAALDSHVTNQAIKSLIMSVFVRFTSPRGAMESIASASTP